MLELLNKEKNETARTYATRVLRHNILLLNLKPGQLVSENEIAEQLNVSRTPVREAFLELSKASLVEIAPQKGTYISLIDMDIVEETRFMRCVLEIAVANLVCDVITGSGLKELEENLYLQEFYANRADHRKLYQLDDQFHEIIFRCCRKEMTFNLVYSTMAHFDRIRILSLAEMDMRRTVAEHREILAAIQSKDGKRAAVLMEKHLSQVISDQAVLRKSHPEYFKDAL